MFEHPSSRFPTQRWAADTLTREMYFHDSVIALPQTAVTPLSCPGREIERKGADGVKEGARESKRTILKAILRNKVESL